MKLKLLCLLSSFLSFFSLPVHAHTGVGAAHGLLDGLLHPLVGVDHLLVMLAVGLWAAMRGGKALWLLPMAFLTAMAAGAGLTLLDITITKAESWVSFSVLTAGVLVWHNARMPSALAVALVAVFAIAHGYVHAAELADGANALAYSAGFLLTTALLHGLGVSLSLLGAARLKVISARFGLLCAVVGVGLLTGI